MNSQMRRRIAAASNDNSSGKSSRFKGLAIVRVQAQSTQIIEYAIEYILSLLPPFVNPVCNEITMIQPMSPGIQVPCVKCLKFMCASPIQKDRCTYNGGSKSSQVII